MPYTSLTVLKPPKAEPVNVALLKQHMRVDVDNDDNLIPIYAAAARQLAEDYLGRLLMTQQQRYSISDAPPGPQWPMTAITPVILPLWLPFPLVFQSPIRLPRFPVQSIDQVRVSHTGVLVDRVLNATTDFTSDLTGAPARLLLQPSAQPALGQHVLIDCTYGYPSAEVIPPSIINAILLGAAYLYEHRGDDGASMPDAFYALLTPYRLFSFGS